MVDIPDAQEYNILTQNYQKPIIIQRYKKAIKMNTENSDGNDWEMQKERNLKSKNIN